MEPTHPAHTAHPEHPDNHHQRVHHPHAENIRLILLFFLLAVSILLFAVGVLTDAPFGNVLLSFAPSIALALIGAGLLVHDQFDLRYLVFICLALIISFSVLYSMVAPTIDIFAISGLNLILGALLLAIISQAHYTEEEYEEGDAVEVEAEQRDLTALYEQIQEAAKVVNISLGRVYSKRYGGSAAIRNKLRIENDDYSELSEEKKPEALEEHLLGILARLDKLAAQEKDVLTTSQLENLEIPRRKLNGSMQVIDVIAENEGENVKQEYVALREYVHAALDHVAPN